MADRTPDAVLQGLCKLVESQATQLSDGQLLSRFASDRDEVAFAVLLQRYSRLVFSVCRNVLRHEHDAEDAFQATFLVFARRAGAIRAEQAVGSWLYRVAYRVAQKARKAAERRRHQESQTAKRNEEQPSSDYAWRELQAMLDQELNRLPAKYRSPFVLCCLLGKSKAEAAAELAWKEGTVSSRLSHARQLLRSRLARRGVMLSALLSGLAISETGGATGVPATLLAATQELALSSAARQSAVSGKSVTAVSLADSALRGGSSSFLKVAAVAILVIGIAGAGIAIINPRPTPPETPPPAPTVDAERPPVDAPAVKGKVDPAPVRRMAVSGSVVDTNGIPVPGAKVVVTASDATGPREMTGTDRLRTIELGAGVTEAQGGYRLTVPQTTAWNRGLSVLAYAPGYALTYQKTDPGDITASTHSLAPIRLIKGQAVRGRLIDQSGKPARRVQVHVLAMQRNGASWLGSVYFNPPVPAPPGWPQDIVTDDDGNFVLKDIGPDTQCHFQVRDDRYAIEWHEFKTTAKEQAEPFVFKLSPPHILQGRVTLDDTGQPLANANVVVQSLHPDFRFGLDCSVMGRTDANGAFHLSVFPGIRVDVDAYPPDGEPYLIGKVESQWPKGATNHKVEVKSLRGIIVRGVVKETGTDKPLPGVHVWHEWWLKQNPYIKLVSKTGNYAPSRGTQTAADGTFSMTVPPGPGALLVKSMDSEFIHVEMRGETLDGEPPGGVPHCPDAFAPLNLKPTDKPDELKFYLRRGVTLRGRVATADGKPAKSAWLISPSYVPEGTPLMEFRGHPLPVRDGRFELPGCDPSGKVVLCAYDAAKGEGVIIEHEMRSAKEPELRMLPFVSALVRIGGAASAVKTPPRFTTELVLRLVEEDSKTARPAISVHTAMLRGLNNRTIVKVNGDYVISNLIAGANYRVSAYVPEFEQKSTMFTAPLKEPLAPSVVTIDLRPLPKRK